MLLLQRWARAAAAPTPRRCCAALLLASTLMTPSAWAQTPSPDALRTQFDALREKGTGQLTDRSIYLRSSESADRMQGEVHALINQPFEQVRQELSKADSWCDVLILHINVKYCRGQRTAAGEQLVSGVGRKFDQPLSEVYWVRFGFNVVADRADHMLVELRAPSGPLSTRDYRIVLEAVPHSGGQSLVRMTYSYGFGTAARWAMKTYLATLGSGKPGFSVVGRSAGGAPILVEGVRGVVERNTLRYYLALQSHLQSGGAPDGGPLQKNMDLWFTATERYADQLREMDRADYVAMKLKEVQRQATVAPPPPG
ncbi:MAG: hypothetical protein Q8S12_02435 [Hydrogenophaga sp.]|uniref:hypothetical protein n=2 Tax=Hydrogenophaga sp. TaxID=1904254 RepID=UPI00271F59AF|nr:hypothetical protein [Hydrogenophaga sp.]MDO9507085.1 hypothetical protein [Hydrogenophaga sp.]MDP3625422.1 hypothetical protein [Hydrogenophaga sp.]